MTDVYIGDVNLFTLTLIIGAFLIIPIQLVLCLKVRKVIIRLIPAILCSIITAALIVAAYTAEGWDGVGYIALAIYAGLLLFACGLGWAVYGVYLLIKRVKTEKQKNTSVEE